MTHPNKQKPSLAQRVRAREPLVGLVVKMPNHALIESAGYSGFDLVVLDTEHGLGDGEQLEHHLRAADSVDLPVVVRIGSHESIDALRALDAGAAGVIFPHVNTAAEARQAVDAAHYPPIGQRGLALSTRAGRHSSVTLTEHLARAREETVVIAQIEHVDGVENVEEIIRTHHLDAVWLGPSDLSMSVGHPGDQDHPDYLGAVQLVVDAISNRPEVSLAVIASDADSVGTWNARGATIFLVPSPDIVAPALRRFVSSARSALEPTATH